MRFPPEFDLHALETFVLAVELGGMSQCAVHLQVTQSAVSQTIAKLEAAGLVTENPIMGSVAAVSMGVFGGIPLLDLNYVEDKDASVDMNLVMNDRGQFIELQAAGEEATFSDSELAALLALGRQGIQQLIAAQRQALITP